MYLNCSHVCAMPQCLDQGGCVKLKLLWGRGAPAEAHRCVEVVCGFAQRRRACNTTPSACLRGEVVRSSRTAVPPHSTKRTAETATFASRTAAGSLEAISGYRRSESLGETRLGGTHTCTHREAIWAELMTCAEFWLLQAD